MHFEKDPRRIIKSLSKSRKLLIDAFESIPLDNWYEKIIRGEWSPNDMLLHIVGWDELILGQAKIWITGNTPTNYDLSVSDEDYNAKYIRMHPTKSKKEAIKILKKSTDDILEFLNGLNEKEITYAIDNESLVDLDLYRHDMEHYEEIRHN